MPIHHKAMVSQELSVTLETRQDVPFHLEVDLGRFHVGVFPFHLRAVHEVAKCVQGLRLPVERPLLVVQGRAIAVVLRIEGLQVVHRPGHQVTCGQKQDFRTSRHRHQPEDLSRDSGPRFPQPLHPAIVPRQAEKDNICWSWDGQGLCLKHRRQWNRLQSRSSGTPTAFPPLSRSPEWPQSHYATENNLNF